MRAIDLLKNEHDYILKVLDGAEREIENIEKTGKVDPERIEKVVDFIRNFADQWHHGKEEDILFKRMINRGMTGKNDPIDIMLQEHDQGRNYVKNMTAALTLAVKGDKSAVETVKENLQGYHDLLKVHINKENMILYPMAERILTDSDLEEMEEDFAEIQNDERGLLMQQKYYGFADQFSVSHLYDEH